MSRSRRHSPVLTDQQRGHNIRRMKRLASKAARKADVPDGCAYKKAFNSWDISDFKSAAWYGFGYWAATDRRWTAK